MKPKSSDNERRWLTSSLQTLLVPAFEKRGFNVVPLTGKDAKSPEIHRSFPFGRLRRASKDGLELVEIQLDKNGTAAFRLNVGVVPFGGISHRVGHVDQDDVWVHYLDNYFTVYQLPLIRRWFKLVRWPGRVIKESDITNLVSRVVMLIPEVERVVSDGRAGSHIRQIKRKRAAISP